jgi:hypothetical protein
LDRFRNPIINFFPISQKSICQQGTSGEELKGLPASGGEGTGDAEKDNLFTGGEGVYGHRLELVFLVEVGKRTVRYHVADGYRGHCC